MTNRCFQILCLFVVANELLAAPAAQPDETPLPPLASVDVNAALTPFWQAVVALAAQSNQLVDQSYQKLKEYGKNGSKYVGEKLQSGGKYLGDELDAGLKNAMSRGYNGYRYVSDNLNSGVQKGKDMVQQGTVGGLRKSVSALNTIGDYRRSGLTTAAQKLNEVLDNLNAYLRKELSDVADVVENPQAHLNVGG